MCLLQVCDALSYPESADIYLTTGSLEAQAIND